MRFIAWPAIVASLTLVIFLMGHPAISIDKNNSKDASPSLDANDSPVQQRQPASVKVNSFPDVESDHSGINEKNRG